MPKLEYDELLKLAQDAVLLNLTFALVGHMDERDSILPMDQWAEIFRNAVKDAEKIGVKWRTVLAEVNAQYEIDITVEELGL